MTTRLNSSGLCFSTRIDSAEVMHPLQARQSCKDTVAVFLLVSFIILGLNSSGWLLFFKSKSGLMHCWVGSMKSLTSVIFIAEENIN